MILDLCGGTGSWSRPYADAGYDVRVITLPDQDVLTYEPPAGVHGIVAAPPCTHFSLSGAQYWPAKDQDGRTAHDVSVVRACLRIIQAARPAWWALENPLGRIQKLVPELGGPVLTFDPWEYGDPYTKRTRLWGTFTIPDRTPVRPIRTSAQGSWLMRLGGKSDRTKELRSMTPPGFAAAFFRANSPHPEHTQGATFVH